MRFVQVWRRQRSQPWDGTATSPASIATCADECDQPIAALLTDLKQRGLLDDTLVIWGGEFGRTPTSSSQGATSRAAATTTPTASPCGWPAAASRAALAYGATDEFGFRAVENKVHVHDLHATILHLLGLDHEQLTYRYAGRDFRLTDVHGVVQTALLA